ncbi:hypothetical protein ACIBO6_01885 [Streptomyces luteogriseus]|uniref:hypothetical protein n=1 Tax=Streptomyces luteogriseus TaxID=68233 RepID=UPI0037896CBB
MTTRTADQKPLLPVSVARAALDATRSDQLLYAGTSLLLMAGLRRDEATGLLVGDWSPGTDPQVTIRGRRQARTIRVATAVAAAVDSCLGEEKAGLDEPLLLGLKTAGHPYLFSRLFQARMRDAGLYVTMHDLRRAAIAAVVRDGTPTGYVEAYFGLSIAASGKQLVPTSEEFDKGIVALLEARFAAAA